MTSLIRTITFDCADPGVVGRFWAAVTGRDLDYAPGDPEAFIEGGNGRPHLLFQTVPEGKAVKNRVHLDLQPADRGRDAEVERLAGLGARVVDDRRNPDGTGFVVMADPEGNELCVERSAEERART